MASREEKERLLILCVDRDGDVTSKTEATTPAVGRESNLQAAISLALNDPEEADANAMFEAVRVYDQLKKQGKPNESFEIATVSGSQLLGVEADRKLVKELNEVLKTFPASSVILVTDGYSDEAILPLVESRVPVTSVRRVIIKHSKSLEETVALFSKYLKMLINNPRYSRIILGIPGLLMIILVAMYFTAGPKWLYYTWIAFLIVLGSSLFVKGFGFDKFTLNVLRWIREYEPPSLPVQIAGFTFAAGIISGGVGIFLGLNGVAEFLINQFGTILPPIEAWASTFPNLVSIFIARGIYLIVMGICVALAGRIVRWYFERDIRLLRTMVIIVVIAWSSQIFIEVANLLQNPIFDQAQLIFTIFVGILIAIASSLVALVINLKFNRFFKKRKQIIEEFKQS